MLRELQSLLVHRGTRIRISGDLQLRLSPNSRGEYSLGVMLFSGCCAACHSAKQLGLLRRAYGKLAVLQALVMFVAYD